MRRFRHITVVALVVPLLTVGGSMKAMAAPAPPFMEEAFGMTETCLTSLVANWSKVKGRLFVDATIVRDGTTAVYIGPRMGPFGGRQGQVRFDVPPRGTDTSSHEFVATAVFTNPKGVELTTESSGTVVRNCL